MKKESVLFDELNTYKDISEIKRMLTQIENKKQKYETFKKESRELTMVKKKGKWKNQLNWILLLITVNKQIFELLYLKENNLLICIDSGFRSKSTMSQWTKQTSRNFYELFLGFGNIAKSADIVSNNSENVMKLPKHHKNLKQLEIDYEQKRPFLNPKEIVM